MMPDATSSASGHRFRVPEEVTAQVFTKALQAAHTLDSLALRVESYTAMFRYVAGETREPRSAAIDASLALQSLKGAKMLFALRFRPDP